MNIKDLSDSLNIPQSRLKKLCLELLGCIPAELSQEDENKIRSAIAQTTQALAAASDGLIPIEEALTAQQQKTREILGEQTIKLLIRDYLFSLKQELDKQKFDTDTLIFQSEQAFYKSLSTHQQTAQQESLERLKRNANYYNLEGVKALSSAVCDDDLLTEIAELMTCFAEDS